MADLSLEAVFGPEGLFSSAVAGYEYRESQVEMASLILKAFQEDKVCALEAGTGTGKSFAYLIPSIMHHQTHPKEKCVIATSTINLQQQLIDKDLPFLKKLLNTSFSYELLLGRSNYICLKKLHDLLREELIESRALNKLLEFSKNNEKGVRTELHDPEASAKWGLVSSDPDTCLKGLCPHRDECFVFSARRKAAAADIIIINHHLFFADVLMRLTEGIEEDSPAILPSFSRLIIDEAHNIEKNGTSYFTRNYGSEELKRTLRELSHSMFGRGLGVLAKLKPFLADETDTDRVHNRIEPVRSAMDELDLVLITPFSRQGTGALRFDQLIETIRSSLIENSRILKQALNHLYEALSLLLEKVPEQEESVSLVSELTGIRRKIGRTREVLSDFSELKEEADHIYWLEPVSLQGREPGVTIHITPLSIADSLDEYLFEPKKTVVCTSATMAPNGDFHYWEKQVGLADYPASRYRKAQFLSPFDFTENMFIGIPEDVPLPNENPDYQEFIKKYILEIILSSNGGTLVLSTSYALLRELKKELSPKLLNAGIPLHVQGDGDRNRLLKEFIGEKRSVLLATESFWEGVDAPGETLNTVIITRLPFRVPTDPIVSARYERLKLDGGNPFIELSLPEAALKLKQGVGRLLRHSNDRGGIFILDSRIIKKRYGRYIVDSLPPGRKEITDSARLLERYEDFLYAER